MPTLITIVGPFKRDGYKITDADGVRLAELRTSLGVTTQELELAGDLLASAWTLRELLRHVLACSGSPSNCDDCKEAANLTSAK
jgi:hypothetical protein